MALEYMFKTRGIKVYSDSDLEKDEYYLACGQDIIMGILEDAEKYAIIHNTGTVLDLALGKKKKIGRKSSGKEKKA